MVATLATYIVKITKSSNSNSFSNCSAVLTLEQRSRFTQTLTPTQSEYVFLTCIRCRHIDSDWCSNQRSVVSPLLLTFTHGEMQNARFVYDSLKIRVH